LLAEPKLAAAIWRSKASKKIHRSAGQGGRVVRIASVWVLDRFKATSSDYGKNREAVKTISRLGILATCACLLATGLHARAKGATLGTMKADRILILGNSITIVGPPNYWGASASVAAKDYAHLLTQRINDASKGSLTITPPTPAFGRWYAGNPGPDWDGNILNIADIFERNYDTWDSVRIKKQLALKPDIVILQFGENIPMRSFDAAKFKSALKTLLTDLKKSSNPEIFMPSFILGLNATVDAIKRELCAEDPDHRVFVDLSKVGPDATAGASPHPNDEGMAIIAETLYKAIVKHSDPK
jgi:lysophospholipase L1-like esterase